jgi:hypothetical protein
MFWVDTLSEIAGMLFGLAIFLGALTCYYGMQVVHGQLLIYDRLEELQEEIKEIKQARDNV